MVVLYRTDRSFPSVSVTGDRCALACPYCDGRYLVGMDAMTPEGLLAMVRGTPELKGLLLSGGCDASGHIEYRPYIEVLRTIKAERTLRILVHMTGVDEGILPGLADVVDGISFDLHLDPRVLDAQGAGRTPEDVLHDLDTLLASGIPIFPHILVGAWKGEISSEYQALSELAAREMDRVVLLVFRPVRGSQFGDLEPPSGDDLAPLFVKARESMMGDLVLGCMRPRGGRDPAALALGIGFDAIVNPPDGLEDMALEHGLEVEWRSGCCVF